MKQVQPRQPRPDRPLHLAGEVVSASYVIDPTKPNTVKYRPVVIVQPGLCTHRVIGFTTQRLKPNGKPRMAIHWPLDTSRVNYLWTNNITTISRRDITKHIGWLDENSLMTILDVVPIPSEYRYQFSVGVYNAGAFI